MRLCRALLFAGIAVMGLTASAAAQDDYPKGEVFGGFSYYRTDSGDDLYGFQTSLSGNFHRRFGVAVDFAGQYDSSFGITLQNYQLLAGPPFTLRGERLTGFAHALFGVEHIRGGSLSETGFAMGLGGGLDINVSRRIAIRAVQVDYVPNRFFGEWFHDARAAAGVVIKFGY